MTEIKIEKKQPVWPWIALIAGILALIYYLFVHDQADKVDENEVTTTETTTVVTDDMNNKVADYNSFISDDASMSMDHEYSSSALMKLIDAAEEVANAKGVDIKADLDLARQNASEITNDREKLNHADKIKSAGTIIVQALKKVQTEKFPNLENNLMGVQDALGKIKPTTPTLDQKEAVKGFFTQAGELLTNMKSN